MPEREIGFISTARLETLADGVFAIVLTLLVLALLDPALARVTTPARHIWINILFLLWVSFLPFSGSPSSHSRPRSWASTRGFGPQ